MKLHFFIAVILFVAACAHNPQKKTDDHVNGLILATQDRDMSVAETAYVELGRIGDRDPRIFEFYVEQLKKTKVGDERDRMERRSVLLGLHSMMNRVAPLTPLIKEQVADSNVRPYALDILWKLAEKDPSLKDYFLTLAKSQDPDVRQDALRFLTAK